MMILKKVDGKLMKMKENDATGRKRRKIVYFYEKILKNEKCADFYADHAGPVGKNMIFYR